jgi:endonuclease YncB( thermonuclease family)
MAYFTVTQIVDGDTFDVFPGWVWNGHQGTRVRPAGYDTPEIGAPFSALATTRLRQLIGGKTVELGKGHTIDRGRLVCEVFIGGRNLASYFPLYRT